MVNLNNVQMLGARSAYLPAVSRTGVRKLSVTITDSLKKTFSIEMPVDEAQNSLQISKIITTPLIQTHTFTSAFVKTCLFKFYFILL